MALPKPPRKPRKLQASPYVAADERGIRAAAQKRPTMTDEAGLRTGAARGPEPSPPPSKGPSMTEASQSPIVTGATPAARQPTAYEQAVRERAATASMNRAGRPVEINQTQPAPGQAPATPKGPVGRTVDWVKAKFGSTPQTPVQAEGLRGAVQSAAGTAKKWAGRTGKAAVLGATGYGAYQLAQGPDSEAAAGGPAPTPGEAQGRGLTPARFDAPIVSSSALPTESATQMAPPGTPVVRAAFGDPNVPGAIMRRGGTQPGSTVGFQYGADPRSDVIFGTSDASGRMNTFTGRGTGFRSAADQQQYQEGLARAKAERDQLTGAIQARLASGDPRDRDLALQMAVTPQQREMVNAAINEADVVSRARRGDRVAQMQLAYGLDTARAQAANSNKTTLELLKLQEQARKTDAEIAREDRKEARESATGRRERVDNMISRVIPPTIDGKPNPDYSGFYEYLTAAMTNAGVTQDQLTPELVGRYKRDYDRVKAAEPGVLDRMLGNRTRPSTLSDVRATRYTQGVFGPRVELPTGQSMYASEYARVPGTGIKLPGLPPIFHAEDADRLRELDRLRKGLRAGE